MSDTTMPGRLTCGGRPGDRLHHDDGTPRGTAATTRGRELEWFDQHAREHQRAHHRTSRTVAVGDRLQWSDGRQLGTVTEVTRGCVDSTRNAWSARVTFDTGATITLTPGSYLTLNTTTDTSGVRR